MGEAHLAGSRRLTTARRETLLRSNLPSGLQILTVRRLFLTAQTAPRCENDYCGGTYEAQHTAKFQPDRMDAVVLCNSHCYPLDLVPRVFACSQLISKLYANRTSVFSHYKWLRPR